MFVRNYVDFFSKIEKKKQFSGENSKKLVKTQGKNPKLKEKTQALGVLILALAPN